ncbi:MAG: Co2+/Mg2+ efflux protein ApaG [Pseudomonadota bacterium]
MYEAITENIKVCVTPQFIEEQSIPDESYFFWAYTVEIYNLGALQVQVRSRFWSITDLTGYTEEIEGPGIVGQEPWIQPSESFVYTSGAPLYTPSGMMVGHYMVQSSKGDFLKVDIPPFSLDSPYGKRILN